MNAGLGAVDQATQDESYDFSAAEITDTAHYITISDPQDVFIARGRDNRLRPLARHAVDPRSGRSQAGMSPMAP